MDILLDIAIIVIGLIVYFIPTSIALSTHRRNTLSIFLLNLFLGWTFVGWVISLVWACIKD